MCVFDVALPDVFRRASRRLRNCCTGGLKLLFLPPQTRENSFNRISLDANVPLRDVEQQHQQQHQQQHASSDIQNLRAPSDTSEYGADTSEYGADTSEFGGAGNDHQQLSQQALGSLTLIGRAFSAGVAQPSQAPGDKAASTQPTLKHLAEST